MLQEFKETTLKELNQLMADADDEQLDAARKLIEAQEETGHRVHATGIGKSSYVAGYAASLMSSTGTPTYFLDGTEAVHGSAGQVVPGDVVIAISNSGETKELLYSVSTLKNNGAKIIGVSRNPESGLSKLSDAYLIVKTEHEGDDLNKPPRVSVLKQMLILQMLSILLQEDYHLDMKKYITWHPGGAIGKTKV